MLQLITHIIADSGNAAFVLNDKSKEFAEKAFFVLTRPWCCGIIILMLFIIATSNILAILVVMKYESPVIIVSRDDWNASDPKPGIKLLALPVKRIIVTHTADRDESCYFPV